MKKLITFILLWILISIPIFLFSQANTSLSNLTTTSINQSLIPQTGTTFDLGSDLLKWKDIYFNGDLISPAGTVFTFRFGNLLVGPDAGNTLSSATSNTFCGSSAGLNTNADNNSFFGHLSGKLNTNGINNCYYGVASGFSGSGDFNSYYGANAGYFVTGSNNSLFGSISGMNTTTGASNCFFGVSSGFNNTTASNNIFIGRDAGLLITTGGNNTTIGTSASPTIPSLTNTLGLGFDADVSLSNSIRLGNTSITKIGIGKTCSAGNILDFQVTTAKLTTGGVWTNASDPKLKDQIVALDKTEILNQVNQLNISRWHYKADEKNISHIGPMADQFYTLFQTGDDTTISTIDPSGVALIAIQALSEENKNLINAINDLQKENTMLNERLEKIEQFILANNALEIRTEKLNLSSENKSVLLQNNPNPFSGKTTFQYVIPTSAISAQLKIYTQNGIEIMTFELDHGNGIIEYDAQDLESGNYYYALFIDGKMIETKQMILTN